MEETPNIPKGTAHVLIVPISRDPNAQKITLYLKEMDEPVYNGARALFDQKKDFDAVRMVCTALKTGGDDVERLRNNIPAMGGLARKIYEMIEPVEAELKKS